MTERDPKPEPLAWLREPWSIEPHGDGEALYIGRSDQHHGLNVVHLTDPAAQWPEVRRLIQCMPELLKVAEAVAKCPYPLPHSVSLAHFDLDAKIRELREGSDD